MAGTRDIRRRIKSVKNTKQITKAMELVAASKMKKAQQTAVAGAPYSLLLSEMLSMLERQVEHLRHPFLEQRDAKTRGVLLVTTDKGLCGALNANLFKLVATELDRETTKFVSIGRKGTQFLARTRRNVLADFTVSDKVNFSEVRAASDFFTGQYVEREIDTLEILYPRFVNTLRQEPLLFPLLPLSNLRGAVEDLKNKQAKSDEALEPTVRSDEREMIFEPDPSRVLANLLPLYINNQIYQFVLEARASEHSARMVAMKTASDNAESLIEDLTLEYNKARQAAITQEILEIAASTASN